MKHHKNLVYYMSDMYANFQCSTLNSVSFTAYQRYGPIILQSEKAGFYCLRKNAVITMAQL